MSGLAFLANGPDAEPTRPFLTLGRCSLSFLYETRSETGMASGTKSKGGNKPKSRGGSAKGGRNAVSRAGRPIPWGIVVGVIVVLALAGGVFTYAFTQIHDK